MKDFNYFEAYLTLRCNLGCSYCINDNDGVVRNRPEMSAEEWGKYLNKINFGDTPLTLGGGEPTQYPGFFELLDRIKLETQVDLLTNLQFDVTRFIDETSPLRFSRKGKAYKSIRVSYHPEFHKPERLVDDVKTLQDAGYSIGIFGINHPRNLEANVQMSELAREKQIYFFIKDFLGEFDNQQFGYFRYPEALDRLKKDALCRTKEVLVDSSGDIYKCHRDLYHDETPIGHISDGLPEYKFRSCDKFGYCNPCDVKSKTNKFLEMGQCAVEIT